MSGRRQSFGRYEAVEGKLSAEDARAAHVLGPTLADPFAKVPVASFWSYDEAVAWARERGEATASERYSKCAYRHTRGIDKDGYGHGSNGRQVLKGTYKVYERSRPDLPFFVAKPSEPTDQHYCGCCGWD